MTDIDAATLAASGSKLPLPWIPEFLGVLWLGNHLINGIPAFTPANGTTTTTVLENIVCGFHISCILDVNRRSYYYPPEKEQMIRTAANTTIPQYWHIFYGLSGIPPVDGSVDAQELV